MNRAPQIVVCLLLGLLGTGVQGATPVATPVLEGFDSGPNNWRNAASQLLGFEATGGPDGSSYVTTTFNLLEAVGGAPGERAAATTLIRTVKLQDPISGEETISSDGAFFGSWLGSAGEFRFSVRHNAPEPLYFFARLAVPNRSPAVGVDYPISVQPNEWTELVMPVDLTFPHLVAQGGGSPEDILRDVFIEEGVEWIQFGIYTPTSLAGVDQNYTLDLDNVMLTAVPEPATLALVGMAGLFWLTRRHQRSVV